MAKKLVILLLTALAACSAPVSEVEVVFPGIITQAPELPSTAMLDANKYSSVINVEYRGDTVAVSNVPDGVEYRCSGANVAFHSAVDVVEYILSGNSAEGSFILHSQNSALVSLSSLSLVSQKRNSISIVTPSVVYIRSLGDERSVVADGVAGDTVYAPKKSAAVCVEGTAVFSGGNITLRGERSNALYCTSRLYLNNTNLSVDAARTDGLVVDSGVVVSASNIALNVSRDAIKCKKGNTVILNGNIAINCTAEKGDGVQSRNFYLFDGNMSVLVSGDVSRGINSKEAVYLMNGNLSVESKGNAIFSEKKFDYSSAACIKSGTHTYIGKANVALKNVGNGGKGINCNGLMRVDGGHLYVENYGNSLQHQYDADAHTSAKGVKCDSTLIVNGGDIDIRVYGRGERCEGLESKYDMIIGGKDTKIYIYAYDDAINAGKHLIVNGGSIYAYAAANDAIDSNGYIKINGGLIVANGCGTPEQGIDVDDRRCFEITGGTVLSVGGCFGPEPSMPYGDNSVQPTLVWTGIALERGKYIGVRDGDNILVTYLLPRTLPGAAFFYSSPDLNEGNEYTLFMAKSIQQGEHVGNGLYLNAIPSDATEETNCSAKLYKATDAGSGAFMPPPPQGFNGGVGFDGSMPPPPPIWNDNEGYYDANLPGGGWK